MRRIDSQIIVDLVASPEHSGQFALFLGAGCSVGAGIPTAAGIVRDAKQRLYMMHHDVAATEPEVDVWLASQGIRLNPETAYSEILERIRPTPRLRRSFLEPYFKDRNPSPAHWALAKLVQAGVLKDLYTTNFDTLIEQSVGQLIPLRVVSYDEQVSGAGEFEREPTLYKLHGDYLFDRIANTESELAHLGASQASKLQIACTRGGVIVAGYSGHDASIMEVLKASALSGIPLGLYWLARQGDPLAPMVEDLLQVSSSCYLSFIQSFDDFVASVSDAVARSRTSTRIEQALVDSREPFVAHPDGVQALLKEICDALLNPESSVVCLSGLPGVGKTATARRVVSEVSKNFSSYAIISAKDRVLTVSDLVDECHLQMPVRKDAASGGDTSSTLLMRYLSSARALLLLDNLDGVELSVLNFLEDLPPPSRALVTIRDVREIRTRIPHVWEIEHSGLTRNEMSELLELWTKRNPTLGRKIGAATSEEVERLLVVSNGWPEAMVMLLTTLSNSLLHINELDEKVQENVYNFILGGLYTRLSRQAKACLVWTGSFPVTFTINGVSAVSGASRKSTERSLYDLIDSHLVKELFAGQYTWSHPIVREFVIGKSRRHAAAEDRRHAVEKYLEAWASNHGGQPTSDWSNFALLDREFENLKVMMERAFNGGNYALVTRIYRSLFSYIVERGYWTFTEAWCERMTSQKLRKADLPDWLIWWSWIKYYLRKDYNAAARLAEDALAVNPRKNRQRFEAHRRALVALGQLGDLEKVVKHLEIAKGICERSWSSESDEAIDLLNSEATALLGVGSVLQDDALYERAMGIFERAERVARRKSNPNTREIGISMLGQARCLKALEQVESALERAQGSLAYAWQVSWLRGIAEAHELIAELAERLGETSLSQSARDVADRMGGRLRSPAYTGRADTT